MLHLRIAEKTLIYAVPLRVGARMLPTTAPQDLNIETQVTIPNYITLFRFVLVPAVIFAILTERPGWALAGFVVAGVSDGVDGFIARNFNQSSDLGRYLDPVADKTLLVSVFVVLGLEQVLPLWVVMLVVSRDLLIVGAVLLSTIMGNPVKVHPLMVSKANTVAQIGLATLALAETTFDTAVPGLRVALEVAVALLTIASAAAYFVGWSRHMSGLAENEP